MLHTHTHCINHRKNIFFKYIFTFTPKKKISLYRDSKSHQRSKNCYSFNKKLELQ